MRYKKKLNDVRDALPDPISLTKLNKKFTITYENSIAILMHQEVSKYNNLLAFIDKMLKTFFKFVAGENQLDY